MIASDEIDASGRRETGGILLGSLVAAAAAYLFLQIGARVLGAARFAPIASLWTLQFLVLAVALTPLEQLVIRSRTTNTRTPYPSVLTVGVLAVLLTTGFAYFSKEMLYGGSTAFVLITAMSVVTLTVYSLGRGLLAGNERYGRYGRATGGHAVVRVLLGAPLLAMTSEPVFGGLAIAVAPLSVLAWTPLRSEAESLARGAPRAPFLLSLLIGNAFAQSLLLGGPLVVGWLDGTTEQISILFVVLTLFRAPVAVANNAVARLLPPFTRLAEAEQGRALRVWAGRLVVATIVLTGLAALLASWVGTSVTALLFGNEFGPETAVVTWIAVGSVLATAGTISNQILIGLNRPALVMVAWSLGIAAFAWVAASAGGSLLIRVATAFAVGEAVAFAGLLVATLSATSDR